VPNSARASTKGTAGPSTAIDLVLHALVALPGVRVLRVHVGGEWLVEVEL
jgi:hypothetical protein